MSDRRRDANSDALTPPEEEFARRAGQRLRRSADELDAATLSRLNQARQKALDEMPGERNNSPGWWLPAGVTVLVAAIAVGVWQAGGQIDKSIEITPLVANDVTDAEILLDESDLEMLENLEFFAWLAEAEMETTG